MKNRDALLLTLAVMGLMGIMIAIIGVFQMISAGLVILGQFVPLYIVLPVFFVLFTFSVIKLTWRLL